MAKSTAYTIENFISNWNTEFDDYHLAAEDLRKPLSVMGAVFKVFDRLGIDKEVVLMPPLEKNLNEHMVYYWDLVPVINLTRVVNHLVSVMPQMVKISINHFLQPLPETSHSILLVLFNLMIFNEERLRDIATYEEELFNYTNMVKSLEEEKNGLFEKLNERAEEKGKRAEKTEQTKEEIKSLEEELTAEEAARDQEKQELETLIKENNVTEALLDQKRTTRDALIAERDRLRALRVYDGEDVRTQAVQATQSVQEAEEKLNSLKALLAQKENSLKILQMIKPNLDAANDFLHDIDKLKDYEAGDLDLDSKDGELEVLNTELMELKVQQADLVARRLEASKKRKENQAKRQQEKMLAESAVREAEKRDKERREFIAEAEQRTQALKDNTKTYELKKADGFKKIADIKENYHNSLKAWEDALFKVVDNVKKDIENKQQNVEQ